MKEVQFVNAEKLETLEQYGASLLSSIISLKTLQGFHIAAFNKGILDEDEAETGKTICWEINRLLALYRTQVENILERTELSEEQVLESLRKLMPKMKIPQKGKRVKKKAN